MPRVESCYVKCPPEGATPHNREAVPGGDRGRGGGGDQSEAPENTAEVEACIPGVAGLWSPCGTECDQERFAEDGCSGEREVRRLIVSRAFSKRGSLTLVFDLWCLRACRSICAKSIALSWDATGHAEATRFRIIVMVVFVGVKK